MGEPSRRLCAAATPSPCSGTAPPCSTIPGSLEEVGAAARLALDHERLQAELHAQLEALRASRARTVEAGDAERRRLERDLHDGAQQRLVVLSLGLRLLGVGSAQAAGRVGTAQAELRGALEDLRELGRGIYPAVLVDEGLAAAVDSLAEEGSVPIVVGPMPPRAASPRRRGRRILPRRRGPQAEPRGGRRVREGEGRLVVEIAATGTLEDDLTDLEDRIGALDGELTVERSAGDRLAVRAEVPCGS